VCGTYHESCPFLLDFPILCSTGFFKYEVMILGDFLIAYCHIPLFISDFINFDICSLTFG
ncbi:hypothetical protein ACQP3L_37885, partial [Escherichia coli]